MNSVLNQSVHTSWCFSRFNDSLWLCCLEISLRPYSVRAERIYVCNLARLTFHINDKSQALKAQQLPFALPDLFSWDNVIRTGPNITFAVQSLTRPANSFQDLKGTIDHMTMHDFLITSMEPCFSLSTKKMKTYSQLHVYNTLLHTW